MNLEVKPEIVHSKVQTAKNNIEENTKERSRKKMEVSMYEIHTNSLLDGWLLEIRCIMFGWCNASTLVCQAGGERWKLS